VPKSVAAFTDISRKLLLQSSIDVEAFVRNDLATVLALAIDLAALHGSGSAPEPKGIVNQTGVAVVAIGADGGAPTWAHIVSLETEIAQDNADIGALAYMTNAKVRGKLKQTEKATNTAQFVWENGPQNAPLNGYRALVSNQVKSDLTKGSGTGLSAIFFGNWRDLIIGQWGTLDMLVDPYTGGTTGTVRVIAFQDIDIAVRHGESFSVVLDADTT
jgi:HK97 family phage major capsid protein